VGRLAYGPVGVITITGIVSRPLVAGAFTNTAVITPTTLDYFPPNNRHSAVLVVELGRIYLPLVLRT
jgi:hypothetical protein